MKAYILSMIAAAVLSAIVKAFVDNKTATGKLIGLLCGVVLVISIVNPMVNIKFYNLSAYFRSISADAEGYIRDGTDAAEKSVADIIKSRTEAYILDKADQMGLDISVEVELDGNNGHIPAGVIIKGKVSPYAREIMRDFLQDDLGIAKENQQWI